MTSLTEPLFPTGTVTVSDRVIAMNLPIEEIDGFVTRHTSGDWGAIDAVDCATNREAVRRRAFIYSKYKTSKGGWVLLATNSDRTFTEIRRWGE